MSVADWAFAMNYKLLKSGRVSASRCLPAESWDAAAGLLPRPGGRLRSAPAGDILTGRLLSTAFLYLDTLRNSSCADW